MKVCHITSAHPQEDVRIFQKECVSLAANGFEVYQVSCGDNYNNKGVSLIGVGKAPSNRLIRILITSNKVYRVAKSLDADLYHFHDPELLLYGLILKKQGKKVIFDSHEDIPGQIIDKQWIPKPFRLCVSSIYKSCETYVVKNLDAVITATKHIEKKFINRCDKTLTINNYPRLDDIVFHEGSFELKDSFVCYAGGISDNRGNTMMVEAMNKVDGTLFIAGKHPILKNNNVCYTGVLSRDEINELYGKSVLGLCILKPIENYYYSQPIKIYEYMAAGLPFVCSNFPSWVEMVQSVDCGICVDPNDINEVSDAINLLLNDRKKAETMGLRGHDYVINNCSWNSEEEKLIKLYQDLVVKRVS